MKKNNIDLNAQAEKKQTRFIFACVANILYIIPCLSCLAMGVMLDGFSSSFILAIITMVLNLPASIVILNRYKKKANRPLCIAISAAVMVMHIISAPLLGAWYIIMSPSFVLYCLIIAWSDVIKQP